MRCLINCFANSSWTVHEPCLPKSVSDWLMQTVLQTVHKPKTMDVLGYCLINIWDVLNGFANSSWTVHEPCLPKSVSDWLSQIVLQTVHKLFMNSVRQSRWLTSFRKQFWKQFIIFENSVCQNRKFEICISNIWLDCQTGIFPFFFALIFNYFII